MSQQSSSVTFDFSDKTAVVTGAAGTLGQEAVRQLAEAGARVLAVDLDSAALDQSIGHLTTDGLHVVAHTADVRNAQDVRGYAIAAANLGNGSIDVVFNNAGIEGRIAPMDQVDVEDFRLVSEVNVIGVLLGLREVMPRMRAGGAIVNTASTAALQGAAGMSSYIASKHAVLGLTRTAAIEAVAHSVRVNAICPGPIRGRMMESLDHQRQQVFRLSEDPSTRRTYSTPADVARVVLFLLSDAAKLLNGQAIRVEAESGG